MDVIGVMNVSLSILRFWPKLIFLGVEQYLLAKEPSRIHQHILYVLITLLCQNWYYKKTFKYAHIPWCISWGIENLIPDKLLNISNWFASCSSNGALTLHQGYLKGYPENMRDKWYHKVIYTEHASNPNHLGFGMAFNLYLFQYAVKL